MVISLVNNSDSKSSLCLTVKSATWSVFCGRVPEYLQDSGLGGQVSARQMKNVLWLAYENLSLSSHQILPLILSSETRGQTVKIHMRRFMTSCHIWICTIFKFMYFCFEGFTHCIIGRLFHCYMLDESIYHFRGV